MERDHSGSQGLGQDARQFLEQQAAQAAQGQQQPWDTEQPTWGRREVRTRWDKVRSAVWVQLEFPDHSHLGTFVTRAMFVLILLSMAMLVLENHPGMSDVEQNVWTGMDVGFVAVFTLELGLRFACSPRPSRFFAQLLNVFDLIAVAPFFVSLAVRRGSLTDRDSDNGTQFVVLRAFRLTRVIRVVKMCRYSNELTVFIKTLGKSFSAVVLVVAMVLMQILILATVLYDLEKDEPSPEESPFYSIPAAMWWAAITITTVGYGDAVPTTPGGKAVACVGMVFGMLGIALPVSIIGANCVREYDRMVQTRRSIAPKLTLNVKISVPNIRIPNQRWHNAKARVYGVLQGQGMGGAVVYVVIILTIAVSIVSMVLETMPALSHVDDDVWWRIETATVAVFTLEFVLRTVTCPSLSEFLFDWMNYIDVVAIAPYFLELAAPNVFNSSATTAVRVLRTARVGRVMKVSRHTPGVAVFTTTVSRSGSALVMLLLVIFVELIVFSTAMHEVEKGTWSEERGYFVNREGERSQFQSIVEAFYWTASTITTVGYGDIVPITTGGKLIAVLAAILGVIGITLPMTVIGVAFCNAFDEFQAERRAKFNPSTRAGIELEARLNSIRDELLQEFPGLVEKSGDLCIRLTQLGKDTVEESHKRPPMRSLGRGGRKGEMEHGLPKEFTTSMGPPRLPEGEGGKDSEGGGGEGDGGAAVELEMSEVGLKRHDTERGEEL